MASLLDIIKHYQHVIEKCHQQDEQRVLKAIDKLFNLDVKVQHLQETGVGRTVNALRKEPGMVGKAARALVYKWKLMVASEESDQEEDHNDSGSMQNESGKDSDDGHSQRSIKDKEQINGNHSGTKRKYHSSEDDEPDTKRGRNSHSSDNEDYKKKHVQPKTEPKSETDYSNSHSESEDESESSEEEEERMPVKVKTEPEEKPTTNKSYEEPSKHEQKTHIKSEPSSSTRSHESTHSSRHSKHSSGSRHSSEKSSKSHSSKDKEHSSDKKQRDPSNQEKSKSKDREESRSSSKHSSEKPKSSSHKSESSDKHKSHEKNKSDKHSSSKSDKEKHKSSSEKNVSSKHKESSSTSKERSSSSKDKSKDKSSSKEKERSSSSSHSKKEKPSSKDKSDKNKSKSDSRSKSEKSEGTSSSEQRSSKSSSEKSKSSSSMSKEDKPKKNVTIHTDSDDDGIGCESGASFAEALGMVLPTKPKKKLSNTPVKDAFSPNSSANNDLSPAALLAPTAKLAPLPALEISALPDISPNYKPRPPPKAIPHFTEEELGAAISSKNQRTKVYSGNKILGKVPTLYEMCVTILQEHIDALEYTGGVPYEILKPVVDKATPQQLFVLEHYNPYLMEDTDHLWQRHCEKNFRNKKRQEMETWREMYMRCQEEQEHKLKSLTANIRMTQEAKKAPIKQTKMAYVDTVVKPPRNIARKQALHGTAHTATASPAARVAALAAAPNVLKGGVRAPPAAPTSAAAFQKPKKAPLMAKALQLMRGRKR